MREASVRTMQSAKSYSFSSGKSMWTVITKLHSKMKRWFHHDFQAETIALLWFHLESYASLENLFFRYTGEVSSLILSLKVTWVWPTVGLVHLIILSHLNTSLLVIKPDWKSFSWKTKS